MKKFIKNHFKAIVTDRHFTFLLFAMVFVCIITAVLFSFMIKPADIQIPAYYTAFGEVHFYKEKWYYLLSFIVFPVFIALTHSVIALKLYMLEKRTTSLFFLWATILLCVVTSIYGRSIIGIAYL